MAYVELKSIIKIGEYEFAGVHDVSIRRSISDYKETAEIKLPSIARTQIGVLNDGVWKMQPGTNEEHPTKELFNPDDPVTIQLAYDDDYKEEFKGFVHRCQGDDPVTIECDGYWRQMQNNVKLNGWVGSASVKELLEMAVGVRDEKGKLRPKPLTGIKVVCTVDWRLERISFAHKTGIEVLDEIMKLTEKVLTLFFIKPDELWCGLTDTPYLAGTKVFDLPTVVYSLGENLVRENSLELIEPTGSAQVIVNGSLLTGDKLIGKSKNAQASNKKHIHSNSIGSQKTANEIAQGKEDRISYKGFEGKVTAFLQPFVAPGYSVELDNRDDPSMDGLYLVDAVHTTFGVRGARRRVSLGLKIPLK